MTNPVTRAALALLDRKRAPDAAQSRYQSERAVCLHGLSNQDKATCLKEAGAALAEAGPRRA